MEAVLSGNRKTVSKPSEHARVSIGERRTTAEVSVRDAPRRQRPSWTLPHRIRGGADLEDGLSRTPDPRYPMASIIFFSASASARVSRGIYRTRVTRWKRTLIDIRNSSNSSSTHAAEHVIIIPLVFSGVIRTVDRQSTDNRHPRTLSSA